MNNIHIDERLVVITININHAPIYLVIFVNMSNKLINFQQVILQSLSTLSLNVPVNGLDNLILIKSTLISSHSHIKAHQTDDNIYILTRLVKTTSFVFKNGRRMK